MASLSELRNRDNFPPDYFNHGITDLRGKLSFVAPIQVNNPGESRYYITPEGNRYPSMTTVLSAGASEESKKAIEEWKQRVGEEEASRVQNHAFNRGSAMHLIAELYLKRDREKFVEAWKTTQPDARENWVALKKILDRHLGAFYASEQMMYSDKYRISGTTDLIGIWDELFSVIDFKTSAKFKEQEDIGSYFVQGDGYGQMTLEQTGEEPQQIVILIAVDGLKEPLVYKEKFGRNLKKLAEVRKKFYLQRGF